MWQRMKDPSPFLLAVGTAEPVKVETSRCIVVVKIVPVRWYGISETVVGVPLMVVTTGVTVVASWSRLTVTQAVLGSAVEVGARLVVVVAGDPHGHRAARKANVASGATFGMAGWLKHRRPEWPG